MKGYLVVAAMLLSGFLICSVPCVSLAQVEEETEYSWGIVTGISSDQIAVSEYDYDTEEEVNVVYALDSNVKLYNITSLQDIAIGDEAWIDYVVRKGEKIIVGIEASKQFYDDYGKDNEKEEKAIPGHQEIYPPSEDDY